jgi:hypothetical protein
MAPEHFGLTSEVMISCKVTLVPQMVCHQLHPMITQQQHA